MACVLLKVDLQEVANLVAAIPGKLPDRLNGLAQALGLHHGARRLPLKIIGVEASVANLLRFFNGRLLPEKHKVLRASAGRFRYDYLVT